MSEEIERALAVREHAEEGWQESLRRLYRRARRRIVATVVGVTTAYFVTFYSPLIWRLAEPLRVADAPQTADAVVVFGGGVCESSKAGGGYQERVKQAVDLYRASKAPVIILCFLRSQAMR